MNLPSSETLEDFITGHRLPDVGAERNRQAVERFLVIEKGYEKQDVEVGVPIDVDVGGRVYRSFLDLVVVVEGRRFLAIKCAAGNLDSREWEIISAARILGDHIVPLAAASDGSNALVWDVETGRLSGEGLAAIPDKVTAARLSASMPLFSISEKRRSREALIFKSYDSMNVNSFQASPGHIA